MMRVHQSNALSPDRSEDCDGKKEKDPVEPFQGRLVAVVVAMPAQSTGGACRENSGLQASGGPTSGSAGPALSLDLVF